MSLALGIPSRQVSSSAKLGS